MGSDIAELIARVEKATGPDRELDAAILMLGIQANDRVSVDNGTVCLTLPGYDFVTTLGTVPDYTASLDSALALVEEKLPGEFWEVFRDFGGGCHRCLIKISYGPQMAEFRSDCRVSAPLAVLEALLRALSPVRGTE